VVTFLTPLAAKKKQDIFLTQIQQKILLVLLKKKITFFFQKY